jgi:hypothetical protein
MTAYLAPLAFAISGLIGAMLLLQRRQFDSTALLLGIALLFVAVVCLVLIALVSLSMLRLD